MKMHSCWKRWQLVQRPSSEASKPEHRICIRLAHPSRMLFPPVHVPCVVCNTGTRLRSAALVPADSGIACVAVEAHHVGLAGMASTCRGDTCVGVARVAVGAE